MGHPYSKQFGCGVPAVEQSVCTCGCGKVITKAELPMKVWVLTDDPDEAFGKLAAALYDGFYSEGLPTRWAPEMRALMSEHGSLTCDDLAHDR